MQILEGYVVAYIAWDYESAAEATNQTFPVFIDLFTFLNSIRGFPGASEGWKIKLTRT